MKNLLLFAFLFLNFFANAQDLPTEPQNGFAFPIGSKFTIKLYPTDSTHFDYSITKFEYFDDVVEIWDNDSLFDGEGEDGTIDFYFCIGTYGETEEDRNENMQILLLMKNRTTQVLKYKSDIQVDEDGEFHFTSNVGSFPGVKGVEMWPHFIYNIGLSEFQIAE